MGQDGDPQRLGGAAVADRDLRRLDVAIGRVEGDGTDASIAKERHQSASLAHADEVVWHAYRAGARDLLLKLGDVLLGAGDLQGPTLGEAQGLAGLVRESLQLLDRPLGQAGKRLGRPHHAGQAGGARRGLRGEVEAIDQRHTSRAQAGQVIGSAGPERARADDDDVCLVDHGARPTIAGRPLTRERRRAQDHRASAIQRRRTATQRATLDRVAGPTYHGASVAKVPRYNARDPTPERDPLHRSTAQARIWQRWRHRLARWPARWCCSSTLGRQGWPTM